MIQQETEARKRRLTKEQREKNEQVKRLSGFSRQPDGSLRLESRFFNRTAKA
ncbi:hypothetical protein MOD78_05270 [Bacillus haynesii]|uniref:hypothetical protein n=1 Tax=Bacillus haynesii TaxID=1925021 RepID=UPI001F41536C|nr:hypothetical protein [Bacillus haynesii]MCY8625015.1 hypothetical protein [Bacillus haynesii]UIN44829.1 hypothetical protein LXN06_13775 [Bacillus licheniformis]